MEPFILRSEQVTLSVPTEADVDRVAEVCADPAIAGWTTVPSPYTRSDAEGFVTRMVPDGWAQETAFTWAVRAPGEMSGAVLGMIGVTNLGEPGSERNGELGYWAAPEARGRGLTTAAGHLVVDWALDPDGLGLTRLQWRAFVGNVASLRTARRLGFRYEGLLRRSGDQRGRLRDEWVASLLPQEARDPDDTWPDAEGRPDSQAGSAPRRGVTRRV